MSNETITRVRQLLVISEDDSISEQRERYTLDYAHVLANIAIAEELRDLNLILSHNATASEPTAAVIAEIPEALRGIGRELNQIATT